MKHMTTYYPDYYKDFKCIAERCRHTCCAGWEIDVDEAALERFTADPAIAPYIRDGSIILDENERCPFLREDGLCKMILEHKEDFICDICKEHPRFYNDCGDHTEAGLGLVCEEACRLILSRENDFKLTPPKELPAGIQTVFDPSSDLAARLRKLKPDTLSPMTRASFINTLEVMDPSWTLMIESVITDPPSTESEEELINKDSRRFSNFCAYLLYRYPGETGFAVESTFLLADLVLKGNDIFDAARMFSGEVEYSDINIDAALDEFF